MRDSSISAHTPSPMVARRAYRTTALLAAAISVSMLAACGSDNTTAPRTLASITISPNPVTVAPGATQQFTATGKDGAGNVLAINPTWTVSSGGGSIDANGMLTAGNTTGAFTVTATSGNISGSSDVTISNSAPNVVGDWTLQTINGKAPPDTVISSDTLTAVFQDGTLTLNQDLSYKLLFHSLLTRGDSTVSDSSGSNGTYSQSGSSVTIHSAVNNGDVVATVSGTTLSFIDGSLTFVFAKSQP